jgi:hypothetical protein
MQKHQTDTYFETQQAALHHSHLNAVANGYVPQYPDHIWTEHVSYGTTVKYAIPMLTSKGNPARKYMHISLYRMDSGRYELTTWLQ